MWKTLIYEKNKKNMLLCSWDNKNGILLLSAYHCLFRKYNMKIKHVSSRNFPTFFIIPRNFSNCEIWRNRWWWKSSFLEGGLLGYLIKLVCVSESALHLVSLNFVLFTAIYQSIVIIHVILNFITRFEWKTLEKNTYV